MYTDACVCVYIYIHIHCFFEVSDTVAALGTWPRTLKTPNDRRNPCRFRAAIFCFERSWSHLFLNQVRRLLKDGKPTKENRLLTAWPMKWPRSFFQFKDMNDYQDIMLRYLYGISYYSSNGAVGP